MAYEVLKDPKKRKTYDQFGEAGLNGGGGGSGGMPDFSQFSSGGSFGGPGFSFSSAGFGPGGGFDPFSTFSSVFGDNFNVHSHNDPFGGMGGMGGNPFGGANFGHSQSFNHGGKSSSKSQPITGVTLSIEHEINVTLEELNEGVTKTFNIKRDRINNGRLTREGKLFQVDVKKGWKDGTKVGYPQEANEEVGKLNGDIVFIIKSKPHKHFVRDAENLIYTIEIDLASALDGQPKTYQVPVLGSNDHIPISISDVISPDYRKRIPGYGLPLQKQPKTKGDLIIKFNIRFPSVANRQVREACQLLKQAGNYSKSSTSDYAMNY